MIQNILIRVRSETINNRRGMYNVQEYNIYKYYKVFDKT